MVKEVTSSAELTNLVKNSRVLVIDFFATWCGPCRAIAPSIEAMSREMPEVTFVKVDVDQSKDIAQSFNIRAMPTFVIFARGVQIDFIQGADLGAIRSAIDRALRLAPAAPTASPGRTADTGSTSATSAIVSAFATLPLITTTEGERETLANEILVYLRADEKHPLGIGLLPFILADSIGKEGFSAFLDVLLKSKVALDRHDAETIVSNLSGFVVDILSWVTAESADGLSEGLMVLKLLIDAPTAAKLLTAHPRFTGGLLEGNGRFLQISTVLGAVLGVGLSEGRCSFQQEIMRRMQLFGAAPNPASPNQRSNSAQPQASEGKSIVARLTADSHDRGFPIVRQLLGPNTRGPTLQWFARFLRSNKSYLKEMHSNPGELATRHALAAVANCLVSLALPVVEGKDFPASIPADYVIDSNPATSSGISGPLWSFAGIERIATYDQENPLPTFQGKPEAKAPKVELFYLAVVAQNLSQSSALIKWSSWENTARHPDVDASQKAFVQTEMAFHRALLAQKDVAVRSLRFANGMAKWLLYVAGCDMRTGVLPPTPPPVWGTIPQHFVDDVVRACELITRFQVESDFFTIMDIVSFTLAFMGNADYFHKPHTHAIFPTLLVFLMQHPEYSRHFQNHPWYTQHILQRCVECYIIVGKAEHEKLQARYYLSMVLRQLLQDRYLCEPIAERFEDEKNPLLETFSHVVTSESSAALEGILDALAGMREQEQANTQEALARDDNYKQKGEMLKTYLLVFNASIDVFGSLATMFPKGVLRNLVAQQICLMLVKSLTKLAGKNSKELKIANPGAFDFDPRKLLQSVAGCLAKFCDIKEFWQEIPRCGIPVADFYFACENISRRQLVSNDAVFGLDKLMHSVRQIERETAREDSVWDDAPEWALCPLLSVPLRNPVALPSKGKERIIVERESIRHHCLTHAEHPYTREPMTMDEVDKFNETPDVKAEIEELKQRIKAWRDSVKEME